MSELFAFALKGCGLLALKRLRAEGEQFTG